MVAGQFVRHSLTRGFCLRGVEIYALDAICLAILLLSLNSYPPLWAQETLPQDEEIPTLTPQLPAPEPLFNAALRLFEDGFYDQASDGFNEWAEAFPDHQQLPQAVEYALWSRAEAQIQKGNWSGGALTLDQVLRDHPNSDHRLNQAFRQAWAFFRQGAYEKALERLTAEEAPFQMASRQLETTGDPKATLLRLRGRLLQAETHLKLGHNVEARLVLDAVPDWSLSDELVWRREFVFTKLLLAEEKLLEARQSATRLLAWARSIDSVEWIAESVALKGDVLQANGQYQAAMDTYKQNLHPGASQERRREARLKQVELGLLLDRLDQVIGRLEQMLSEGPADASLDVVLLSLGEIYLKRYFGDDSLALTNPASEKTEWLPVARKYLEQMLETYPQSPYVGRACYALGWCLWQSGLPESAFDVFNRARGILPPSLEQAECLFKLGDICLKLGRAEEALEWYQSLLDTYPEDIQVRAQLLDQILYQILKAAILAENISAASMAAGELLHHFPTGPIAERSQLLLGQELMHVRKTSEARELFGSMLERFGHFATRPFVELSMARSLEMEGQWSEALKAYDQWLMDHPEDERRDEAVYGKGWAEDRLGKADEAMDQFRLLIEAFPDSDLIPLAQRWIGDHYFNQGDHASALAAYGAVIKPSGNMSPHRARARLMMGRCCFHLKQYDAAVEHLAPLVRDADLIKQVLGNDFIAEVFLCQGDAQFEFARSKTPINTEVLRQANGAYTSVYAVHRPNRWEPLAWGRRGDLLYFEGEDYAEAISAYEEALRYESLSIATRSQLMVSIGMVKERLSEGADEMRDQEMENQALNQYLQVVYQKNLKRGEVPDAFWLREAGVRAMGILERQDNWQQAQAFTDYLGKLLPAQQDEWLQVMQQWQRSLPQINDMPNQTKP